ncbi:glycosyltransferase family 2 protein [Macellibacteroides fermentans]|uniref:glycosyltransferase family 2 protein n=1 Tax=Macellibacteroides fermentans TaxID=879969 RepID=UPI003B942283
MLSIVCPIYNEEKYISQCIDSLLQQDYPKEDLEILLVDGMSTDNTRTIVKQYSIKYPYIHLIDNPKKIVPCAMNIGIKNAKGNIIIRLDAHATYEKDYFSVLSRRLVELEADNVGVVCKTDVLNKSPKSLAIREVLGNKFGVGNSAFRTGINKVQEVDTVPFGCWRREVFDKYGMYDERLIRNQDIELSKRIIRGGGKIFIVPDTYCTYLAREKFSALAKNNYQNGKWNILTVYYTKQWSSLSIRHFVPMLFILSIIGPTLLSLIYKPFVLISIISLLSYIITLTLICIPLCIKKKLKFYYLLASFITLHFSYGWGSIIGIFKLFSIKN